MRFLIILSVFFFMLGCAVPIFWLAMLFTLGFAWSALKKQNRADNDEIAARRSKQDDKDRERAVRYFQ